MSFHLGVVEAHDTSGSPPTMTVDGKVMRYLSAAPVGETVVYCEDSGDPFVLGRFSQERR